MQSLFLFSTYKICSVQECAFFILKTREMHWQRTYYEDMLLCF
jgi:hypothetical protein